MSDTPTPTPVARFDMGAWDERKRPPKWHDQLDRRVEHIERDMKFAKWIVSAIFLLVVAIAVNTGADIVKAHFRDDAPLHHSGERLAPDRIEEPAH